MKKNNIINIIGWIYCLIGALSIPTLLKLIFVLFSAPSYINQPAGNAPSGKDIFMRVGLNTGIIILTIAIPILIGIGIMKRRKIAKTGAIIINILVLFMFPISFFSAPGNINFFIIGALIAIILTVLLCLNNVKKEFIN